jgi:hypothetical protein
MCFFYLLVFSLSFEVVSFDPLDQIDEDWVIPHGIRDMAVWQRSCQNREQVAKNQSVQLRWSKN